MDEEWDPERVKEALKHLSPEDRKKALAKMDEELEKYMAQMESKSYKYVDGWDPDNWEEELEKHPLFARNAGGENGELSPLLQGIQDLKYSPDENTPEELAKNYKEDGNYNFKFKKYRHAVLAYSEGLRHKCADDTLNAQLLTNRAAAQFHLGNYRSSLLDARLALKKNPDHMKAVVRGAECALKLKRYAECRELADLGLELDPKEKRLLELRTQATNEEKARERDARREAAKEKRMKQEEAVLLQAIRDRGVTLEAQRSGSDLTLKDLEPLHPAALHKRVHFSPESKNILVWPVLFLYPEHGETDFIEAFSDDQRFEDHVASMFGPGVEPAPWDAECKYKPGKIRLFFEDAEMERLVPVDLGATLGQTISHARYRVRGGTPGFIVLVEGSPFYADFVKKYKK